MPASVVIEPYSGQSPDQIYDLILSIQTQEFGVAITRQDQPDLGNIPAYYQQGVGNFWLALCGEEVIGTIALKDIGNNQVALRKMFVHADHRGAQKGVGRRLLHTAVDWATTHGVTDIFLGTTAKYLAAHRFYEKNGFREIDRSQLPETFSAMLVDTKFYRLCTGSPASHQEAATP
jgi:N-acetylglutamate synthase-like GNAT family acetyltransferase